MTSNLNTVKFHIMGSFKFLSLVLALLSWQSTFLQLLFSEVVGAVNWRFCCVLIKIWTSVWQWLTDTLVCVSTREFYCTIVAAFWILPVLLVNTVWYVSVCQAVIHEVHLKTVAHSTMFFVSQIKRLCSPPPSWWPFWHKIIRRCKGNLLTPKWSTIRGARNCYYADCSLFDFYWLSSSRPLPISISNKSNLLMVS